MKKGLLKLIKSAFLMVAVLLLALPITALAEDEPENPVSTNGLTAGKYITVQEDGTYIIDLEAFATGEATFETVPVPADIILVLDVSGSMDEKMGSDSYEYTERTSQAYSYSGYGNSQYYYKDNNGNYHQVFRTYTGNSNRRYYLRYSSTDNNNNWVYLQGTGTTNTQSNGPRGQNDTIWTGVLYTQTTIDAPKKIEALRTAVDGFIDEVASKNKDVTDPLYQSRIAVVKYAGDAIGTYSDYQNPGQIGNSTYNYNYYGTTYTFNRTQVVADLGYVTEADAGTWKGKVNAINAAGPTSADYGMGYADAIFDKHPLSAADQEVGRQRVVIMFTDGEPNHWTGFDGTVANSAIAAAKSMKDDDVLVYSIAVYDGASNAEPPTSDINKYLHAISSNYPSATGYNSLGTRGEGNFYFVAENASQLEQIFKDIGHSSGQPATTVSKEAVMKDIVSSSFTLPEGATADDIHIKIVRWDSRPGVHDWGEGAGYEFTPEQWATATEENVSASISSDGKTVDITGFDYAKHFKATSTEQDNDQYDVVGGVNKDTAKVVVSFQILAKPSAVTGGSVATNGEMSGIYVNGDATEPLIKFVVPHVVFTPVTYVVDYVTSDTSTDTKASTIKLDYSEVLANVDMLDDPSDDVLIGEDAVDFDYTIYKGRYGTISFGDDEVDVQRKYVRYAPTTMNWNDYDRIFVKGPSKNESNLDVWAMLAVIPANSVFYEDTYISQTKTVTYNDQQVTIEYTGINYDSSWDTVGTEGTNQTQHAGDEMGWVTGLADDSSYANDMAHKADKAKAKASFTFSGTGLDIYSRTNGTTGTVSVRLQGVNPETGKKFSKTQLIDCKAAAGDFFAIPVCTFTDLAYGEYTVTITVTTGGQNEDRMTFYLDGIRVYNPIKPLEETDEVVKEMYGEKHLGAVYTEVRSMLCNDPAAAEAQALYIDEYYETGIVPDVAAIETAAKALADAQAARDAYVEGTITPAKNAVSREEYALSSAQAALNSATTVYNTTVETYNAAKAAYEAAVAAGADETTIAELQTAMNKAKTNMDNKKQEMDDAQDDLDDAQDHYDANIETLREALDAAIAGRAELDAAIEEARTAYEEAAGGDLDVAFSDATIEQYVKDGPKHEVLLDKNQAVAITVEAGKIYYIGLRSLNGDEVTAKIGTKTVKLSHSVDLYYEATPTDNTIVVQNTSDNILSVTKLRTSGAGNKSNGMKLTSTEKTMNVVRRLAKMTDSDEIYSDEVLTPEEAGDEETEVLLDEEDIIIENEDTVPENEVVEEAPVTQTAASPWASKLSSFFKFFRP